MASQNFTYVIGHKSLDADHEQIISLWQTLEATRTIESARGAASHLMDKANGHFACEEAFLRQCGFPGLGPQCTAHRELASDLRRIILVPPSGSGSREDFVASVRRLMGRWVNHIVMEDTKVAPYARTLAHKMTKSMAEQRA